MKRMELFLMVIQVPLDFLLLLLAGVSAYAVRVSGTAQGVRPVMFDIPLSQYLTLVAGVAVFWIVLFALGGLYAPNPNRRLAADLYRIFLASLAGLAGVALFIMFTQEVFNSRFLVAASWAFAVAYISVGRLFVRGVKGILYRLGIGGRRVAVVGVGAAAETLANALRTRKGFGYAVVGAYGTFDAAVAGGIASQGLDEIIFANPRGRENEALRAIAWCIEHHVVFKYSADLFATYSTNMSVQPIAGMPIVEIRRTRLDGWGRVVKRACDIVGSMALIILASPLMLLTAVIILLETGRPIIYKNERVGAQGKRFVTLKFRSMYQRDSTGHQFGSAGEAALRREAELIKTQSIKDGPVYKIANDPRVTPWGRFIRRWSIDELPQFFNVLIGTMSTVGPRPHQPREVAQYENEHKKVLAIKPGVTGLAQISGRSDLSFDEEVQLDVFYLENWNLLLDAIIFLKTPFILFKKRKAL